MRHFFLSALLTVLPAAAQTSFDFAGAVAPIFEKNCTRCHHAGTAKRTRVELTSRRELIQHGVLSPGNPDKSSLYTSIANGSMPPGGKLSPVEITIIRNWIQQDAPWPEGVQLKAHAAAAAGATNANELAEVEKIRERILTNHEHATGTKTYQVTIPNTTVKYGMTAIPAGEFNMGSDTAKDEQPIHKVKISAFWMQTHEVTWDEYRLFMFANQAGEVAHKDALVDGVSRPTRPYVEMSFGMGINGYPAISMTQHAASKYAEWLSAKTGEFYRLPTEAEWEYACRGGSSTSTPSDLADYAWFATNSGGKYQKVATKKPNPWGLFDMLGNVMEWTLDQYAPYKPGEQTDPWVKPSQPYPIVARGGSWNDPAKQVTCSARVGSDPSWKQQDPQLPKSIWYETDAQWLGFRLVRPEKIPSAQEMYSYWNNGVEHDEQ